jgi:hypothetical protein
MRCKVYIEKHVSIKFMFEIISTYKHIYLWYYISSELVFSAMIRTRKILIFWILDWIFLLILMGDSDGWGFGGRALKPPKGNRLVELFKFELLSENQGHFHLIFFGILSINTSHFFHYKICIISLNIITYKIFLLICIFRFHFSYQFRRNYFPFWPQ